MCVCGVLRVDIIEMKFSWEQNREITYVSDTSLSAQPRSTIVRDRVVLVLVVRTILTTDWLCCHC